MTSKMYSIQTHSLKQTVLGGDGWVSVFITVNGHRIKENHYTYDLGLKQIIFYTNRNNL